MSAVMTRVARAGKIPARVKVDLVRMAVVVLLHVVTQTANRVAGAIAT
jgi:hypothetical protein